MDINQIPESVHRQGTATIAILADWFFEFSAEPTGVRPASILFVEDPLGVAHDAIAWLPGVPEVWWQLTGVGDLLGLDALLRAAWVGSAIAWMPTPAAWFQSRFWGRLDTACYLTMPADG